MSEPERVFFMAAFSAREEDVGQTPDLFFSIIEAYDHAASHTDGFKDGVALGDPAFGDVHTDFFRHRAF